MADVADDVLKLLASHPWGETVPRLTKYALEKMRRRYWQGVFGGPAPGGAEAKDIAQASIEKVLKGQREWDPVRQPDLYEHLRGIVDSEISHLVESWENQNLLSEAALSPKADAERGTPSVLNDCPSPELSPEAALLEKERERLSEEFFWDFFEFLAENPLLQAILECLMEGIDKRSDIAAKMAIKTKEFDNLKKQLRRKLKAFQEQRAGRAKP